MARAVSTFRTGEPNLQLLLQSVHEGKLQLPDFQRSWVWRDEAIRSLLASVSLGYPIGSIMLFEVGGDVRFLPRPIEGALDAEGKTPEHLILDGQQRMSSLYLSLFSGRPVPTRDEKNNRIERIYYLDMAMCLDLRADRVDAVISLPPTRKRLANFNRDVVIDVSTSEKEWERGMFPASLLLDGAARREWRRKFFRHFEDRDKDKLYDDFEAEVVDRFEGYRVPTIELTKQTPKQAVCQVFEVVNTGGVRLNVFELVTATFAAEGHRLRQDWTERQKRLQRSPVLERVSETDLLQAVTLLDSFERYRSEGGTVSCKRKDILDLELDNYKRTVDKITEGFLGAARLLNAEKIYAAKDVPYSSQLVPLAAIIAALGVQFEQSTTRTTILQWYWSGVFGELYGGATESRFAYDVVDVVEWVAGREELPRTVVDANFSPIRLLTLRSRQSAAYKGLMARLMQAGSRDFMSGDAIELTTFFEHDVDIHHIFPRAYCRKAGLPDKRFESVVNKTPLTARTNRVLGGKAPSEYLLKITEDTGAVTPELLDGYIATHLANADLLRADSFDQFIADRARQLLDEIEKAIGKPVEGRESDEVVSAFGKALTLEENPDRRGTEEPTSLFDEYEIVERIHGGGMAEAYKVRRRSDDELLFMKRVRIGSDHDAAALQREQQIYSRLQRVECSHTLQVVGVERDGSYMAIVTEYADGGDLATHIDEQPTKRLTTTEALAIAVSIAEGLAELHEHGIVHRDLKPENILLAGNTWKIADFGIAKSLSRLITQHTFQQSGTLGYAAPEQLDGAEARPSADIYSFGKLIGYMITGQTDVDRITFPSWRELVQASTARDPDARPNVAEVLAKLRTITA